MNELIRSNGFSYERYEELVIRKNALQKECFQLEQEYIREFGEDTMAVYRLQLECARKKKTIEFCQMARNRGQEPDQNELGAFLARETAELQEHFQKLRDEYDSAKSTGTVTEAQLMDIRKTYRRLAKLIHPDLHPELGEAVLDLWNQITAAYTCNDLESLKELEVLVAAALVEVADAQIEIPDIEEKIAKIETDISEMMSRNPYQFKFLLEDEEAVKEKHRSLKEEEENFRLYSEQLDRILEEVLPAGTFIIWNDP